METTCAPGLCYTSPLQISSLQATLLCSLPGCSAGPCRIKSPSQWASMGVSFFLFFFFGFNICKLRSAPIGPVFSEESFSQVNVLLWKVRVTEIWSGVYERCPLCRLFHHKLILLARYGKMWTFIPVLLNEDFVGGAVYQSSLLHWTWVISLFIERSSKAVDRKSCTCLSS